MFTTTLYKATRKVSFHYSQIINSHFVLVRASRQKTTLNKPITVGFSTNSNSYAIYHIFIVIVVLCYASTTCYHVACLSVRVCLSVCHIRRSNVAYHIYVCLFIFCVRMSIYHLIQLNVRLSFCCMFVLYQSIHLSVRPYICPSVTRRYSVDSRHHSTYPQFLPRDAYA